MRRILDTAGAFGEAAWAWWSAVAAEAFLPPALGPWLLALIVLLLLAALRRRRPPPLEVRPPQLLITQGEVLPETGPQGSARRRRRGVPDAAAAGVLTMTLSNLSRYPVQVLEVALRQESRGAPRVVELEALAPPLGALELEVRVPLGLSGDGWLDVYCYAAAPRQKLHRHRAELVWEPWVSRFKVAPMEQATSAAKRLASDERNALFDLPDPPAEATAVPAAGPVAAPASAAIPGRAQARPERTPGDAESDAVHVAAPASDAKRPPAVGDEPRPVMATVRPAVDATPLGALWARLPKGPASRGAVKEPRETGERDDARERPEGADAPKRPKLEFPEDF